MHGLITMLLLLIILDSQLLLIHYHFSRVSLGRKPTAVGHVPVEAGMKFSEMFKIDKSHLRHA